MIKRKFKYRDLVLTIMLNLVLMNSLFPCDCTGLSVSEKYLQSDVVLVGKITDIVVQSKNGSAHGWTYKLVESIKGIPLDTILGSMLCGPGFRVGDEVLIYGRMIKNSNRITTSSCSGSRRINNKKNIVDKFELRALRMHATYIGEKKDYKPVKWKTKIMTMNLNPYRSEFYNVRNTEKKCKAAFVLIQFSSTGEIKKIKFLNRAKRKIRKSIIKIINEDEWTVTKEQDGSVGQKEIIRCFLYPTTKLEFIDF